MLAQSTVVKGFNLEYIQQPFTSESKSLDGVDANPANLAALKIKGLSLSPFRREEEEAKSSV